MPDLQLNRDKQCWKRKTSLEKKLIYCVSVLVGIALILLLVIILRKTCEVEDTCGTKNCVKAAAELLEFIDLKADPCENFYRYACGSYHKNAVKKDTPSPWTSTETLFKNEMKGLVVDPLGKNDTNGHIALKLFYHECMNTTKIDEDDNETFMKAIDELGGWPLINGSNWKNTLGWADWYIKAKQMGLPVIGFFDFKQHELPSNDTIILKITPANMDISCYYSSHNFKKLMRLISEAFESPNQVEEYKKIEKVIDFVFKYRNEISPLDDDEYEIDDDEEVNTQEEKIETGDYTIRSLTEICPKVPWLKILNSISSNSSEFSNFTEIKFSKKNMKAYCEKLDKLLSNTDYKVIVNYYIWSIIHNAHKFMNKDIRRAYGDVDEESDERYTVCLDAADERFKYVKETVYIRRRSSAKVRADLFEMIEIMQQLFIKHIKECTWMDEETKKAGITKVNGIKSIVGSLDELYDSNSFDQYLGVDGFKFMSDNIFKMLQEKMIKEDHHLFDTLHGPIPDYWPSFFDKVMEVNAFFLPDANMMVIPAPILTSIFYNKKFPGFMNYGPMGSTVGHEFMHGFSKFGQTYTLDNDTEIQWWTNATSEAYDKAVQCVIDEYESIPFRYRLNGTMTLEENVADYVGAHVGYESYQIYVSRHGKEQKLTGLPLTPEQIYWVQTATNFCFKKLDDNSVDYEEKDEHGIPAFRVEAPARNSIYFAEAFNCPVGTRMNPEKKCHIF